MNILSNTELKSKIERLIYDNEGGESITESLCKVIDYKGSEYEVHLTITTNENDFHNANNTPKFRLSDGELIKFK